MSFGERVKQRRKEMKLTQKELAGLVGISRSAVNSWEMGDHIPGGDPAIKLPTVLHCSWDWLTTGRTPPEDTNQANQRSTQVTHTPLPIVEKPLIPAYLRSEVAATRYASAQAASIRDALGGSKETFVFIETIDGMKPKISAGDTVFIDPLDKNPAPGTAIWLFNTPSGPFLGAIKETPRGIMLHFDNSTPGWEPIPVTKDDCLGKLVAFLPVWLGDLNNAIRNLV